MANKKVAPRSVIAPPPKSPRNAVKPPRKPVKAAPAPTPAPKKVLEGSAAKVVETKAQKDVSAKPAPKKEEKTTSFGEGQ